MLDHLSSRVSAQRRRVGHRIQGSILLQQGWRVVGVSRKSKQDSLHEQFGEKLIAVQGSVDKQATADAAFAEAERAGELRLIINCAGPGVFGEIGGYSAADIAEQVLDEISTRRSVYCQEFTFERS